MKPKSCKLVPHPWYKRKPYLHFDFALKKQPAIDYVLDKANVIKHSFLPLIHYSKITRKYRKNEDSGRFEFFKKKRRNIFYASHIDGYIYGYYNFLLSEKYEAYLTKYGLSDNVSAYRLIEKNGQGYSNIQFAKEVFDYVKTTKGCRVLCIDITGFFDNLCIDTLKNNWHRVWSNDGPGNLEEDHYRVFLSLKNFRYIEEKDIILRMLKNPRERNKIDQNNKVARRQELNRSLHQRVCSFPELKAKMKSGFPVRSKEELEITGIPQGTAISGMLANIFMIDFDLALKKEFDLIGGFYRRYSDDIFVSFPDSFTFVEIETRIENALSKYSKNSLKINSDKTNRGIYVEKLEGVGVCHNREGKLSPIQYLGFVFHGDQTHVRSSSVARHHSKIVKTIKKYKKGRIGKAELGSINTRRVYQLHSPRKITKIDRYEDKGFPYYVKRAIHLQSAPEMGKQILKSDKFIQKKIAEER